MLMIAMTKILSGLKIHWCFFSQNSRPINLEIKVMHCGMSKPALEILLFNPFFPLFTIYFLFQVYLPQSQHIGHQMSSSIEEQYLCKWL